MADLVIASTPAICFCVARGVASQTPAQPRDTGLDRIFNCMGVDTPGLGLVVVNAYGSIPFVLFDADGVVVVTGYGTPNWGSVQGEIGVVKVIGKGGLTLEISKKSWVQWSDIGSIDFTIWKDNVAGERPMDWRGWAWKVRKLYERVVVYGENGVSNLVPSGTNWGLDTVYRIGLKGKNAMAGNEKVHYFIDNIGQLFMNGQGKTKLEYGGLTRLGYEEYLSSLRSNVVLTFDEMNDILYICDGVQGFVYRNGSLGKGPVNITGLGYQGGIQYIVSPGTIVTRIPEICTDTYDLETRKGKSITSLEIGIDTDVELQASIKYRLGLDEGFKQTGWYDVDNRGQVFIPCFGYEFQFLFRTLAYEWVRPDYIKVNGKVHDK